MQSTTWQFEAQGNSLSPIDRSTLGKVFRAEVVKHRQIRDLHHVGEILQDPTR